MQIRNKHRGFSANYLYWAGLNCKWVGFELNPNPNPLGFHPTEQQQQQPGAAAAALAGRRPAGAAAPPTPAPPRRRSGAGFPHARVREREKWVGLMPPHQHRRPGRPPAPPAWPGRPPACRRPPLLAVCREREGEIWSEGERNEERERERE